MAYPRKLVTSLLIGNVLSATSCYYFWQKGQDKNTTNDNENLLKHELLTMAEYNKWTYIQIQNWCKDNFKDDIDLYDKNTNIPFKTIRNTLCHLWCGDQLWYCLMNGIYDNCGIDNNPKSKLTMEQLSTFGIVIMIMMVNGKPYLKE